MATVKTANLLPEIFRTKTNQKFLNTTLEQLVQQPDIRKLDGYIGRKIGLGVSAKDSYIAELTKDRANYQLEPAVVTNVTDTSNPEDFITYPGIVNALKLDGALTARHDRLFDAERYSWDPFVDYDKFINFSQYYWLPQGPDSVDISATEISSSDEYTITRNEFTYAFSDVEGTNPTITVARDGNYKFNVNQLGHKFSIQMAPGKAGTMPGQPNQSSRNILGVTNNSDDVGTIEFKVPSTDAQNFFLNMDTVAKVDLATTLRFDAIHNQLESVFLKNTDGIDEIRDLQGRTVIFLNRLAGDPADTGWQRLERFDDDTYDRNETKFDEAIRIHKKSDRYSIYRIELVSNTAGTDKIIKLNKVQEIANLTKVQIQYGKAHNNMYYYKDAEGYFDQQPLITALTDKMYYQDHTDDNKFGIIRIVDAVGDEEINVTEDIIGQKTYTSPTGVILTTGMKIQFRGKTEPAEYQDQEYYVEGVGGAITLSPLGNFKTPESYTVSQSEPYDAKGYDESNYDSSLNAPTIQDYFTINRASLDQNPWSRSNRWFHEDVIKQTAGYNKTTAVLDQTARAKRPILEFHAGLRLYDYGTESFGSVKVIDSKETDALSNVAGQIGYFIDGVSLEDGDRVIFTADSDSSVKNKIYKVSKVDPQGLTIDPNQISQKIIKLDLDQTVSVDQMVFVSSGVTQQGQTYYFDGTTWKLAQQKTAINQSPLFDIFDVSGSSIGDSAKFPSTNFAGTKLFSYAEGTGPVDKHVGVKLKYQNINNIGDIVFNNDLSTDTFTFTTNAVSTKVNVGNYYAHQHSTRTAFDLKIGWEKSKYKTRQAQVFEFTKNDTNVYIADVRYNTVDNAVLVYVNNEYLLPSNYTKTRTVDETTVTITKTLNAEDVINIKIISDQTSKLAYYEIPENMVDNAVNTTFPSTTLGTIRNHFVSLGQSHPDLSGTVLGANNLRDLGNIVPYGSQIVEQSAPMQYTAIFAKDSTSNFFDAIDYASHEYQKFKNKLIDTLTTNSFQGTVYEQLDDAIAEINKGKSSTMPFYWADSVPCGANYTQTKIIVSAFDDKIFDLSRTYDFTKANYNAVLIYLNDQQLILDQDYTVSTNAPTFTIADTVTISANDIIIVREYESTVGAYIPATPTQLGLYDRYTPVTYTDDTYTTAQTIIQGHDGSKTVAFGDDRDAVIMEFEKRMYNNIKVPTTNTIPLRWYDVIPGKYRTTDYSPAEAIQLWSESFLNWTAQNNIDYTKQDYDADNWKTHNYSTATDQDGDLLLGGWKGNFLNYYDTDTPHITPWEMLGITQKPTWWETQYGPAPFTSENENLWDDIAAGIVKDPAGSYIVTNFIRDNVRSPKSFPVTDEGTLKNIFEFLVNQYNDLQFKKSWVIGDGGPAETAWRRSSDWPFAVQKMLAKAKPAQYFTLMADRDRYKLNAALGQYVFDDRKRLTSDNIKVYGEGIIKHSYINYSVDFAKRSGVDAKTLLQDQFANTTMQLVYRVGGFTDKKYLKVYTEKTSPNSSNTNLLIPDESFSILLHQNEPEDSVIYSSVTVQKTEDGWSVNGNSKEQLYFKVYESIPNGNFKTIKVGDSQVNISNDFTRNEIKVPYGFVFTNIDAMSDFLISYGDYLQSKGFIFDDVENNYTLDWGQMINEFLYWNQQGWEAGSIISLNPNASKLKIERAGLIAAPVTGKRADEFVLDQNNQPIPKENLRWDRIENQFEITTLDESAISYLKVKFTSYEHALVFDNTTIFNDLVYDPKTVSRQARLKLVGMMTNNWTGTLNAPGFVLNQDTVKEWTSNREYSKGDIVKYKNKHYSALQKVQPAETFDFVKWDITEYESIKQGLLPNLTLKSQQVEKYYDTQSANLEGDADLLGFGLIGYRNRDYLQGLALDDVSQTNIYKNFIAEKGTSRAVDLFKSARFDKDKADYSVFENWAIKTGKYGASSNRSYVEIDLKRDTLTGNPSTLLIGSDIGTDQKTTLDNVYKSSYKVTDNNILSTITYNNTENSLPDAGFVNPDHVDLQVFDLSESTILQDNLEKIVEGTMIWVAKDNAASWNVYRATLVKAEPTTVNDNLDGTVTITFNGNHGLKLNEQVTIKSLNTGIDGVYRVQLVPTLSQIVIAGALQTDVLQFSGIGIGLLLQSVKVTEPSAIGDLPFVKDLTTGDRIWVDSDEWSVIEKTDPYGNVNNIHSRVLSSPQEYAKFGEVVSQSPDGITSLIGAPNYLSAIIEDYSAFRNYQVGEFVRYDGGIYEVIATVIGDGSTDFFTDAQSDYFKYVVPTGAVFQFGQVASGAIEEGQQFTLQKTTSIYEKELGGYGSSISQGIGYNAVGAPKSKSDEGYVVVINSTGGVVSEQQLIINPENAAADSTASEFGHSVAMSNDASWLYVGAPGTDKVYTYQKRDVEAQQIEFTGEGSTVQYTIINDITVDDGTQVTVNVNNLVQTNVTDYQITGNVIAFNDGDIQDGDKILITRNTVATFTASGSNSVFDISTLYNAKTIEDFYVTVNEELMRPEYDYTFNTGTQTVTFTLKNKSAVSVHPSVGHTVQFFTKDHFEYVSTISNPGSVGDQFGKSVSATNDGRQLLIGAPRAGSSAGKVYVYDREVERFQVSDNTTLAYTTDKTHVGQIRVTVNDQQVYDTADFKSKSSGYTDTGKIITFDDAEIQLGDIIEVETNNFVLADTLVPPASITAIGSDFGHVIEVCGTSCSIYVGAPKDSSHTASSGSVHRYINRPRLYGAIEGTVANPTLTAGNKFRINNYVITLSGTTVDSLVTDITNKDIPNVKASKTTAGRLLIELKNSTAAPAANKLLVLPSTGTVLTDLGITLFPHMQSIANPYPITDAQFGYDLDISADANSIIIGAPKGPTNLAVTLDKAVKETTLDAGSTKIRDSQTQSGAVFTYDYLSSNTDTYATPGQFVYGQQILDLQVHKLSEFGKSVDYATDKLLIGAPGYDENYNVKLDESSRFFTMSEGRIVRFFNEAHTPVWKTISSQTPVVDSSLINSMFLYNKDTDQVLTYLDHIDPLQGKILGAARQNIDYIIPTDPAGYNQGQENNYGVTWANEHVGEVWWDVSSVRFINYNQSTLDFRAKRTGQLFEGSTVDVYQWIQSEQTPDTYTGDGTPLSTTKYTQLADVREGGEVVTRYYFWVKNQTAVYRSGTKSKTLSTQAISQYIANPKSSGIPYVAIIDKNSFAFFNSINSIVNNNAVFHVEFDKVATDNNVHNEFELIKEADPTQFLSSTLYRKFQDSFCGVDSVGNLVPDPALTLTDKRGVQYRPRQTMFVNRFTALKNYITATNRILAGIPITEIRSYPILESVEQEPTASSKQWDIKVANYDELTYQNISIAAIGTRYLVQVDSTNDNRWTIYTLQSDRTLLLSRVQNFKTTDHWELIDWYDATYNKLDKPTKEVAKFADLATLTETVIGNIVKVTANAQGKFEIYKKSTTGVWNRVGLEKGTIKIKPSLYDVTIDRNGYDNEVFDAQYFDSEPVTETRQIIKSINDELFVDDLAIHRIDLITLMFNYILSEQKSTDWLIKTSLIDVQHNLRDLKPFNILKTDNQTFVESYIKEIKPYRSQIKEFNLVYQGTDTFAGDTTDFDLPAQYNATLGQYESPRAVLGNGSVSGSSVYSLDDDIWSNYEYTNWKSGFALSIDSVTVFDGGTGYTETPIVVVTGNATTTATMTARISTAGKIIAVDIVNAGAGYTSTPEITFEGGNGTGAKAFAVVSPGDVRSYKTTVKFDRYEYATNVVDWAASTAYPQDQLLRHNNKVYKATTADGSTLSKATFDPLDYTLVAVTDLSGVDRTMGLYQPGTNYPGLDLSLLVYGTEYPGVKMLGPGFEENTGYDIGNYDINVWDNLDFDDTGKPSYAEDILNAKYQGGDFSGTPTGLLAEDINVEGGAFIDSYASHSPEELIPGAVFDTLNMSVSTRPGEDYTSEGWGAATKTKFIEHKESARTISFADLIEVPFAVFAYEIDSGKKLKFEYGDTPAGTVDYTVDWNAKTITFSASTFTANEKIGITAHSIGGGNQLYREDYIASAYLNNVSEAEIVLPVEHDMIKNLTVLVNGERTTNWTLETNTVFDTKLLIGSRDMTGDSAPNPELVANSGTRALNSTDRITVCVLGYPGSEYVSTLLLECDDAIFPDTAYPVADMFTVTDATDYTYNITQHIGTGVQPETARVYRNGLRLRPSEGFEHTGDGTTVAFSMDIQTQTSAGLVADNEITVYVDDVKKTSSADYIITPTGAEWDGSTDRQVQFNTAPANKAKIKIFIDSDAEYKISRDGTLTINSTKVTLSESDHIAVYTDGDTSEQNLLTQVHQGPTTTGFTVSTAFDSDGYDSSAMDKSVGVTINQSVFNTGRTNTLPERILVHVNGVRKFYGQHWDLLEGDPKFIEFKSLTIDTSDIVTITLKTENTVPDGINFQVFHDMNDTKTIYRCGDPSTALTTKSIDFNDERIYVDDVSKLPTPDMANGTWGYVMIDGERIAYREINTSKNYIHDLRRGVHGTAIASHAVGSKVINMSSNEYVNWSYSQSLYASDGKPLTKTDTFPAKFIRRAN